jgi:hypothetical protein
MLKVLILNAAPEKEQETVEAEFHGQRGHQFEWLRKRYVQLNSRGLPGDINRSLVLVSTWDSSLRYKPGLGDPGDASRFLREVENILQWADSRV